MRPEERLIVALDTNCKHKAAKIIREVDFVVGWFKIGLELLTYGQAHDIARFARGRKKKIFADFKLHDIPATIGKSVLGISETIKPDIFSIDANLEIPALVEANWAKGESQMFGVGPLTSDVLLKQNPEDLVLLTASKLHMAGADGIICPAFLAARVKNLFPKMKVISPGIPPLWFPKKDNHAETVTPSQAVDLGADYIVVGRPISQAPESVGGPRGAAEKILEEIAKAGGQK